MPRWLREITYDQWRDIRFRPERALWRDKNLPFTVQFFHPGFYYDRTVRVNVVTATGVASVPFSPDSSTTARTSSAAACRRTSATRACASTIRSRTRAIATRWSSFLGASYFRAVGRDQVYGLSARGLAIDTAAALG